MPGKQVKPVRQQLDIFDLPEEIRISLDFNFKKEFLDICIRKAGSQDKLAFILSENLNETVKRGRIKTWLEEKYSALSLRELKFLLRYTNLKKNILSKNIFLDENLANIIGHLYGDGGIHGKHYSPWYSNKEGALIFNFVSNLRNIGIFQLTRSINPANVSYIWCPQVLGLILSKFGIKAGDKVKNKWIIPEYFFNLDSKLIASFLKGLFDDDATVSIKKRQIHLFSQNKEILTQVKLLLIKTFGITTGEIKKASEKIINGRKELVHYFSITHRRNFIKFYNHIGFDCPRKQKNLEKLIGGVVNG